MMNSQFNFFDFDNQEKEPNLFTFSKYENFSFEYSSQLTVSENDNDQKEDDIIKSLTIPNKYNIDKNKKSTKLGRKKKNSNEIGKHNKFSVDNLIRKSKALFHKHFVRFLNGKLKENNIILSAIIDNKKYSSKNFLKMKRTQNYEILTSYNLALFDKKMRDYMSEDLSEKCTNYPTSFHKEAIYKLYEEKKNKDIIDILELKYLDCFKYYRGDEDRIHAACLKGLDKYFSEISEILAKEGNEENYINEFISLTKKLDSHFKEKKPRELKSKSTNNATD